jgi:hypothetical protein
MSGNIQVVVTGTFLLRTLFRPEQWIEWVAIALGDANIFKLLKSLLYCGLISRVAQIVLVFEGTLQKVWLMARAQLAPTHTPSSFTEKSIFLNEGRTLRSSDDGIAANIEGV